MTAGFWRPSGRPCWSSTAPAGPLALLRRHLAPVAARAGRPRIRPGPGIEAQQAEIERMESFIERFRYKARRPNRPSRGSRNWTRSSVSSATRGLTQPGVLLLGAPALRPGDLRADRRPGEIGEQPLVLLEHAELWLNGASMSRWWDPTGRARRPSSRPWRAARELAGGKLSIGHNVEARLPLPARRGAGRRRAPEQSVLDAAQRATGLSPTGPGRSWVASCSPARRSRNRSRGSRAAAPAALAGRPRRLRPRPPNVLILTSPPTISTSRAARRSRTLCGGSRA